MSKHHARPQLVPLRWSQRDTTQDLDTLYMCDLGQCHCLHDICPNHTDIGIHPDNSWTSWNNLAGPPQRHRIKANMGTIPELLTRTIDSNMFYQFCIEWNRSTQYTWYEISLISDKHSLQIMSIKWKWQYMIAIYTILQMLCTKHAVPMRGRPLVIWGGGA